MNRPMQGEYDPYFDTYIKHVNGDDFMTHMKEVHDETQDLIAHLDDEQGNYRYDKGKWSIKELVAHLIDTERIFCSRALSIARGDKTPLPGYDHEAYVQSSKADNRNLGDLMAEYSTLRESTIDLFSSFDTFMLQSVGNANGKNLSVRAIGFIIPGHEIHHRQVLVDKYGVKRD